MKEILTSYFIKNSYNDINISEIINLILYDNIDNDDNMIDILYDKICPKLVVNAVEIFESSEEKYGFVAESIRDILSNYFKLLSSYDIISEELIYIFTNDITTYFENIVGKIINLWLINIENILRFFINNYRCLQTYLVLLNN